MVARSASQKQRRRARESCGGKLPRATPAPARKASRRRWNCAGIRATTGLLRKTASSDRGAARSAWTYIWRYRSRLWLGGVLLVVTNAFALSVPWLLGSVVTALEGDHPAERVPALALAMVGLAAGQALSRILSRVVLFNAARMAEYDLRSELFTHLMRLDGGYFRAHPTGDVMSRLTNDVQTVRAMWGPGFLNVVNTAFLFTAALVLMLGISPWLTLWALLPYPCMVLLGRYFGRRLYRRSREVQESLGDLSSAIQEDLTGIAVIKTYTLESERRRQFARGSGRLLDRNMELTKVRGQLVPALSGLASIGTVIVLWVGGAAVIGGEMSLGQLVQFNAYLALLVWPTLALGWMLSIFQRGMAAWARLRALLETRPAIESGPEELTLDQVQGHIELRDLRLSIDDRPVLQGISLDIPAGTSLAIVGRTGAGKSSLVECVPRLIDAPPGSVLLDGRDVTRLPLSTLRRAIGYAPQDAYLFSTTIAENIAYGLPDDEAGGEAAAAEGLDPRVHRAAEAAGLARDIAALPRGYDTLVGERGITLSGGQRQRVALARAIASEPRVLILDDSLSSVDAHTERTILGALDEVMKGRTAILISHRVAAARRADRIAVIDDGRLVELGTHDELIAQRGLYAELYRTQLPDTLLGDEVGAAEGVEP
jgi:ATP-binding cassette, subfamily B, multidrug efflux pump